MPSLREISVHFPALVIDAASSVVQVGLLSADGAPQWWSGNDEAGVGVFQGVEQLGIDPQAVGMFIFCDGPGSVLGIRTVAMALRTWTVLKPRPVYAYCSLAIVAHALRDPAVTVIADARRESWHQYRIQSGLKRCPASELTGTLVMPEDFRHWSTLPAGVRLVPYSLPDIFPLIGDADLFQATDAPDAFLHEEPSYVTWTPQIHRAVPPR